jgi:glycosyltransferase involved in cell wall biosynthesis
MFISVIIICRNEDKKIQRCIDSIIINLKDYNYEIIFVDSASTDHTIDIASKYKINIYQLNQSKYLSPSAGRYIGTPYAKGEYVLFVDGDSIIIETFMQKALQILKREDVAAVAGNILFRNKGESLTIHEKISGNLKFVDAIGGTGLYKTKTLKVVGTFNPYMKGQEERELCFRIRSNKYKIAKLDIPMIYHISNDITSEEANEKAGYFTGVGQIIRKYGLKKITWELIYAQRKALTETSAIFVAIIWAVISVIFMNPILAIGDIAIFLSILFLLIYKGKEKVSIFFAARMKLFFSIIKGFCIGIDNASTFDNKVKVTRLK